METMRCAGPWEPWPTWAAIGIPGNWEAGVGGTHLGSHRNTWESIGMPGQLWEYLVSGRLGVGSTHLRSHTNTLGSVGIPWQL